MPNRHQHLEGKVFGHLTVLKDDGTRGKSNAVKWLCRCDCGRLTHVTTNSLNSGETQSCGHIKLRNLRPTAKRHASKLGNKLIKTNKTGERNISILYRNGRKRYRVAVVYNRKQHGHVCDTMQEALIMREKIREKYWPNYKSEERL